MKRLVMLGGALPQRLAPSAGAEYVAALAEELSGFFEVTAFAPAHQGNREAIAEERCVVPSHIIGPARPGLGWRLLTRVDRGLREFDLALPPLDMTFGLFTSGPLRRAVRSADIIDLQWTEFVALAPMIRRINPQATVVGTLHDSLTQVAGRKPRTSRKGRLLYGVRRRLTARHEGQAAGWVHHLRVINAKDAAIVRSLANSGNPIVIHPPRPVPKVRNHPRRKYEVLIVGAFGREVNQEAVSWMLRDIWPAVRATLPEARLVLAGSDPDGFAARAAHGRADVVATGFVQDLGDCYASASAAAVPLLNGGGVKFKTIDALLHGLPVVTTSVGSEGIDGHDLFWSQTDDAKEFAEALVTALTSPEAVVRAVAAGRKVAERYSRANFARSIRETYGGV